MITSQDEYRALAHAGDLEGPLVALEDCVSVLGRALFRQDGLAVERAAAELHIALATAVDRFTQAARAGAVSPQLRRRLATAGGQVAAQREALARATASLDRAIDVLLLPGLAQPSLYSAAGSARRALGQGGSLLA